MNSTVHIYDVVKDAATNGKDKGVELPANTEVLFTIGETKIYVSAKDGFLIVRKRAEGGWEHETIQVLPDCNNKVFIR
jgi:hypothetical protein